MQKSILLYLSKLEGFKTAIKNCHWAAKSMNAHEFMDSLEDIVTDHQDLVAEITQGAYNTKIKVNDFKAKPYRISTFTKLVGDILKAAEKFYDTIQGNRRFIGLRSTMEDFMAKMNQQAYLNAMCTESLMKVQNMLKESKSLLREFGMDWDKYKPQIPAFRKEYAKLKADFEKMVNDYTQKCNAQGIPVDWSKTQYSTLREYIGDLGSPGLFACVYNVWSPYKEEITGNYSSW